MTTEPSLFDLQPPPQYRASGREHIFPSPGSLDWFIRRERERLVKAGALRLIAGRWMVVPSAFDRVVLDVSLEGAQGGKP